MSMSTSTQNENTRRRLRTPIVPHTVSTQMTFEDPNIPRPPYSKLGFVPPQLFPDLITLHDTNSIPKMRAAGQLARTVLDMTCDLAKVGVTTDEIDKAVFAAIVDASAYPSPLNYRGFPKSVCTSVNEVICHGIPDSRALELGDVVSFDVSCFLDGVHGDNCATVIVGDSDGKGGLKMDFEDEYEAEMFQSARRLVSATLESLDEAVNVCRPGACLTEVGNAIQEVSDSYGYESVMQFCGHGIGERFHCAPFVKHYRNNDKLQLHPGMIFTIEPMLTERSQECSTWSDGWTVITEDGGRAAQFEHTVLITETGVEIITVNPSNISSSEDVV